MFGNEGAKMSISVMAQEVISRLDINDHSKNDYFAIIKEFVKKRQQEGPIWQEYIDQVYARLLDEILHNPGVPLTAVKFGTSGWRGLLGKDIFIRSVSFVTEAILELYMAVDHTPELVPLLGVQSMDEAQKRGCVIGFDNRFGGEVLAAAVIEVLARQGFTVHYAGESTTGVLSAAVLELGAAFSINLTPSHNPLEYGGYKYNAADAGPAASELTTRITDSARKIILEDGKQTSSFGNILPLPSQRKDIQTFDSLEMWKKLVRRNVGLHGLDYDQIIHRFENNKELVVVIDSVHGASRLHIGKLFNGTVSGRLLHLRSEADVTFGGVAPEPSSVNMRGVVKALVDRPERLKLGAIIDPDGDRIRFTDGITEIGMNQFGAMSYHFLHEIKGKKGMVAKTVATSNMANNLAKTFGEQIFEPRVGFKEFKPVIGEALVYFEESDGISIIGHTPEKDAYIGLLLALDMVMTVGKNLGEYLHDLEKHYGAYYPDRDGIGVILQGDGLIEALAGLEKYSVGAVIRVGEEDKIIREVIDIDGRKMIFEDGSWVMIRPSGTEPKVRFYVESRTPEGSVDLVKSAKAMLAGVGLL
jgi:phosphomannomutase